MPHAPSYDMLSHKLELLSPNLSLTETEESWDKIAKATSDLARLAESDGAEQPELITAVCKAYSRHIINAMNSERTRLAGAAIDSVASIATSLGPSFDPLVPHLFPAALHLCSRTNKVTLTRSRACVLAIIEATHHPSVISHFLANIKDKSASLRVMSAEGTLACLNSLNPPDLERGSRPTEIESIIRATAADASAEVRKVGKKLWDAYKIVLPNRVDAFTAPLSPTMRKYLDIKGQPPKLPSSSSSTSSRDPGHRAVTRSVSQPKVQLSSSTSALRKEAEAQSSLHTRAASADIVPVVGRGDKKKPLADMLPPALIPSRPTRTQMQAPAPRHQRTMSTTSSTSTGPQRPTVSRPNSRAGEASARTDIGPRRAAAPTATTDTTNASRQPQRFTAPIPKRTELQEAEKIDDARVKAPVRAPRPAPPVAGPSEVKRATQRSQTPTAMTSNKADGEVKTAVKGAIVNKEKFKPVSSAAKATSGGIMRPTQAQLARAQATAQGQAQKLQTAPPKNRSNAAAGTKIHPKDIPLPPSPKAKAKMVADLSRKPTIAVPRVHPKDIPLPASPKAKAKNIADPPKKAIPTARAPIVKKPASGNPSGFKPVSRTASKTAVPPPRAPIGKKAPVKNQIQDKKAKAVTNAAPTSPELQIENEVKPEVIPIQEGPSASQSNAEEEMLVHAEESPEITPAEVMDDKTEDMELVSDEEVDSLTEVEAVQSDEAVEAAAELSEADPTDAAELTTESEEEELLLSPVRPPPTTNTVTKTPISSLLSSIEQGFMFTPPSPLSPPEHYANMPRPLAIPFPLNLSGNRNPRDQGVRKGPFRFDKEEERGVSGELDNN